MTWASAREQVSIDLIETLESVEAGPVTLSFADVEVTTLVTGYQRRLRGGEILDVTPLDAARQEEIAKAEVTGEAGAGLVKVTMNGRHDVRKVDIDPSLLSEDKEILEDLLAAAVNDAVRRVEANQKDKMSGMMSGMGMPPGFKMPF